MNNIFDHYLTIEFPKNTSEEDVDFIKQNIEKYLQDINSALETSINKKHISPIVIKKVSYTTSYGRQ